MYKYHISGNAIWSSFKKRKNKLWINLTTKKNCMPFIFIDKEPKPFKPILLKLKELRTGHTSFIHQARAALVIAKSTSGNSI